LIFVNDNKQTGLVGKKNEQLSICLTIFFDKIQRTDIWSNIHCSHLTRKICI